MESLIVCIMLGPCQAPPGTFQHFTHITSFQGSSNRLDYIGHHIFNFRPEAAINIIDELKSCVEKHWQVHLSPPWSSK